MGDPKALLALIFTMITWGLSPVVLRSQAVEIGAADSLVIRYTIVALIYAVALIVAGKGRIARADWPRLLTISLLGMFCYSVSSMFGFEYAPAGVGGLIYATQPLLIILLAAILLREALTPHAIIGIAIAAAGTVLLFWHEAATTTSDGSILYGGMLLFLGCIAWAVYSVASRPLLIKYGPLSISAWSIIIATVPMYALSDAGTVATLGSMTIRHWIEIMFLAVMSTFIAVITWNLSIARLPATTTGAFLYLVPVIAITAGALLLGESVTITRIIGGLLILLGVAFAQFGSRLWKLRREQNAV